MQQITGLRSHARHDGRCVRNEDSLTTGKGPTPHRANVLDSWTPRILRFSPLEPVLTILASPYCASRIPTDHPALAQRLVWINNGDSARIALNAHISCRVMDSVTPLDFLNADPRPACVVDFRKARSDTEPQIEFCNRALQEQSHLLDDVLGINERHTSASVRLREWIADWSQGAAESTSFEWFGGYSLFCYTINKRWRVIQWQQTNQSVAYSSHKSGDTPRKGRVSIEPSTRDLTLGDQEPVPLLLDFPALFESIAVCRELGGFWTELVGALVSRGHGVLFAFVYSLHERSDRTPEPTNSAVPPQYQLACERGCQSAGMTLPATMDVGTGSGRFSSACRTAQRLGGPLDLDSEDLMSFQGGVSTSFVCAKAVLCPIRVQDGKTATGFLVVGLKPGAVSRQLSRAWLRCVTMFASERLQTITNASETIPTPAGPPNDAKTLKDALADRDDVTEKLASTLAMMEMVDVGMFEYNMDGKLVQANKAFYKLSGHPRDATAREYAWTDCIFDEDSEALFAHWNLLLQGTATNFEMRWKRPAISMHDGLEDLEGQWVLAACVPTRNVEGHVMTVSGCITDIAAQKRSQKDALERAEALERAQASENRFSRFAELANVAIYIFGLDQKVSSSPLS